MLIAVNVHGRSMARLRKPAAVTMKDVAREAGVSYQTVSRAINGYPEISPETRKKVLHITERIGYRPNRLAGSLRTSQSNVLGLIVSDVENVFSPKSPAAWRPRRPATGIRCSLPTAERTSRANDGR
jgi:transcriptional regulator with XRE-family HTH domain